MITIPTIELCGSGVQVPFHYDPRVVLPPDVISHSFAALSAAPNMHAGQRILDLGTGSGIFACATVLHVRDPRGLTMRLSDLDPLALATAEANLRAVITARELTDEQVRVEVSRADWLEAELAAGNTYHHVYFNPPYLPEGEEVHGEATASPAATMYAGDDGLSAYAAVFPRIHEVMAVPSTASGRPATLMVREPYSSYHAMALQSRLPEPPLETHSPIIKLFVNHAAGRAWPVPQYYTCIDHTNNSMKAGGGFIAQYFAPQASDTP